MTKLAFNIVTWRMIAVFVLFNCSVGCAQEFVDPPDETTVKMAAEEAAIVDICPDRALLKLASMEVADCREHVTKLAPVCWHLMDSVVHDYKFGRNESEKDRFFAMAALLASCVRGELLRQIVKESR